MTPQELDAIRARDATTNQHELDRSWPAADRRALLAEVDRLTAENAALRDEWDGTEGASPAWWRGSDHGVAAERARIRAGVEGLACEHRIDNCVDRVAVLRVIDGGEA
jgi:hypothetical protein